MSHFEGHFEGAKTFLTQFRGQKCCCLLLGVLVCCCVLLRPWSCM
jgi:hypothetical protein